MKTNRQQFSPKKKKRQVIGGVTVPALPYYYLWYGPGFIAPYGGPGGANETAQNDFGKDIDGASPSSGSSAAGGDASAAATV